MLSLHQLTCFLATYEHRSLTRAAEALGYAQPSVSEQIRNLERSLDVPLFRRVGRGVVPTTVADTLRPYAERVLSAVEDAEHAVGRVKSFETGTIRFGMFGSARFYAGADLVSDVLERYPGVRLELIGAHSIDVQDQLRRGQIEAALIAVSQLASEGLSITPVARDELVYISADPAALTAPVTADRLAEATLAMAETTWRATDSVRTALRQMLHEGGHNPPTRIEVEDIETAIEIVGRGLADSVINLGAASHAIPRLAPHVGWVELEPRQYTTLAIAHRAGATLSPAAQLMIELATARIRAIAEPV